MIHRTKITIRHGPSSKAASIALLGEISDWRNAIALSRLDDGSFARTIDLESGVYQYKLLVREGDRTEWILDEANERTRSEGGRRNNIVVVDGAPEPWLFAPSSPWVNELDRGGTRVLVGVRRPLPANMSIAWSEDDATWTSATVEHAFDEDEHAFFVATLAASAPAITIAIAADGVPRFTSIFRRTPAAERVPTWWKKAAIYTIFVDRFRPAVDHARWERELGKSAAGGHLDGIRRSLDALHELGFDTLYLTPVHVGASVHRYDLVDPLRVDPALGGEDAYRALVEAAKARGMRILQDISFAHAGRGFPAFEDVLTHGRSSRFASWFVWNDAGLVHYGKRTDAPLFDLENAEVQALVLDTVASWAKLGASGLRLDMTAEIPLDLGRRIRRRFKELVPDGVVLGEVVPQHAWRWRNTGVVDAATDFGFHEVVTDLVCRRDASAAAAFAEIERRTVLRGGDPRTTAVRFLSTHDHPRLASLASARGAAKKLVSAYALLATMPGVPMLLYGEEAGMRARDEARELEDVWPDRAPMPWSPAGRDAVLEGAVVQLFTTRRASAALRHGTLRLLFADATTLVYRREADGEVIDVALSFDEEAKTIELEDDENPRLVPRVMVEGASASGSTVVLPPYGFIVASRERVHTRAIAPTRARRNLVLRDEELVLARDAVECRPSRFFFSVTERCNLRCEHCITHAPERTANGSARTLTPAVLDALRDDLGLADYFAFVHGGESLTAPIFFDVLAAVKDARGSEPYVAHLLSNGVLLTRSNIERLVALGLRSLSVSLDGATASTNDAIRTGGRFDDVRTNLERILEWRAAKKIDLRVGLSYVVLAQNVAELDAFVDLGASLGVDWIKLEEGVPATPFAKRSLVACSASDVRLAIDRALDRGRAKHIVMVDHTIDRTIWRCQLDDATRTFLEADEHANRGPIHPCRTPWETVCIEPNGDVRVLDFFGPIVGNVTQAPLADLWNARAAQEARLRTRLTRICGPTGPVTCV